MSPDRSVCVAGGRQPCYDMRLATERGCCDLDSVAISILYFFFLGQANRTVDCTLRLRSAIHYAHKAYAICIVGLGTLCVSPLAHTPTLPTSAHQHPHARGTGDADHAGGGGVRTRNCTADSGAAGFLNWCPSLFVSNSSSSNNNKSSICLLVFFCSGDMSNLQT